MNLGRSQLPMSELSKSPKFAVIDYGMGNLRSVLRAWQAVGADAYLVQNPQEAERADALVFPGQGAIVDTMQLLKSSGMDRLIKDWIAADRPFFGICLGLQALFEFSEEGNTEGLGIFKGQVKRFPADCDLKVPHGLEFRSVQRTLRAHLRHCQWFRSILFCAQLLRRTRRRGISLLHYRLWEDILLGYTLRKLYSGSVSPRKSQVKGLQLYTNF